MKAIKLVALLTLSCLAGYFWLMASIFIIPSIFDPDLNWHTGTSSPVAEFVLQQAVPGGIGVAIVCAVLSVIHCLRQPPQA